MSKNDAKLEMISISKIELGTTNPRKSIDTKALKELSVSIKEHGILQPILVRPYVDEKSSWQDYQLVCGERRYRAALLAGLEEIPVNIRTLTDEEAFELQIVENLERKDVHPLDEAEAFKSMLDSGKYTIEDIAAKMAKSESFITQRLKLIDLIDEIKTDFIAGHLGIGHAILIARCTQEKQSEIHKSAQPWRGEGDPDYDTISELKENIENDSYELTQANFDLNDSDLIKECGACTLCPKRSGANPVLFEDMHEDRCFDEKCFDEKQQAYLIKEVSRIIHEGEDTVLVAGWGNPHDMIKEMCKQFGVEIYPQYTYGTVELPNRDWVKKKAFRVCGTDEGKYIDVWVRPQEENTSYASGNKSPLSNEEIQIKEEIAKIESRADRAYELDGEKVWTEIRAIDTSEIKTIIGGLFEVEINAVCLAMISKLGYHGNQEVKKLVGEFTVDTLQERHFTKFEYNQIQRIFFLECLPVAFGNYYSNINNYAYTEALMHYEGDKIKEIIANQKSISDVRMDKSDAKIKVLKEKLKALKPIEDIQVEAEEVVPAKKEKVKK